MRRWPPRFRTAGWASTISYAIVALATGLLVLYYAAPNTQLHIIRGWQILTLPIAWTVGHILLSLTFFLVVLPIGWVMRLSGYDPLKLRNEHQETAWEERDGERPAMRYYRQY